MKAPIVLNGIFFYTLSMNICVVSTTGIGNTTLSAFDNALKNAGVYNYNIIPLSSIIPMHTRIVKRKKYTSPPDEIGYRLYVVKADIRTNQSDKYIAAGLGWYLTRNGAGIFVEHEMETETKDAALNELTYKISSSIEDMCKFRGEKYNKKHIRMSIAVSEPSVHPRCALAIAVYKAEPW
jgi:arginine decarboxylase